MRRGYLAAGLGLLLGGSAGAPPPVTFQTAGGAVRLEDAESGALARASAWRTAGDRLEWTELRMHGRGEARRTLIVVARFDPRGYTVSLENGMAPGGLPVWTLQRVAAATTLAFNAGMFEGQGVWGWVVHRGVEYRPPRRGPLAAAVVVDRAGLVRVVDDAAVDSLRAASLGGVAEAFQSYPVLLRRGEPPAMVRGSSPGIDLAHRDARLALGVDPDGRVLVALTRFDALGPSLGSVPFGLTIPEMAEVMRGLGAISAVALDGGVSAQMLLRESGGTVHRWEGFRRVPLAMSVVPRGEE